jgi:hypothetical protein
MQYLQDFATLVAALEILHDFAIGLPFVALPAIVLLLVAKL